MGMSALEAHIDEHRSELEAFAYRMLGDGSEAEDVVSDAFLRWYQLSEAERIGIAAPRSWLFKVTSRIALDRMKSARSRRECYVGPWLPEPWLMDEYSPLDRVGVDESVTLAMMLALEHLSPAERAVLILREVFAFGFEDIAQGIGKTPSHCRKLLSRARSALRTRHARYELDARVHQRLLTAFSHACAKGDLEALRSMLAQDVQLHTDGGGVVSAARRIVSSNDKVSRFFVGLSNKQKKSGVVFREKLCTSNALPTLVLSLHGRIESVISFAVADGKIERVFIQRNPRKLQRLSALDVVGGA